MTDQQLYLAISLPILANFGMMFLGFTLISSGLNKRLDDVRADLANFRAEVRSDMGDLRAEMRSDIAGLRADVKLLTGKVYEMMGKSHE